LSSGGRFGYDRATSNPGKTVKQKALLAAGIIVLVLAMAWVRVALDGRAARGHADQLLAAGKADVAVGFYDRALHMYWPGSPDVARAVAALTELAEQREATGDLEGAVHAWRVLRSGLYAARGLYLPYADVVAQSEDRIAALVGRQLATPGAAEDHLAKLRKSQDPNRGWSLLAILGFAAWVGGAIGFLWRGMTPQGKLVRAAAIPWAGVFFGGYLMWLVGLYLA
jgi:hypothetical protein